MKPQNFFENLTFKRRALTSDAPKAYRVYKDEKDFIVAKGKTVIEALKASGIENAYRVVLHDMLDETVLDGGALREHVEIEKKPEEPAAEPVAEPVAAAAEEPAKEEAKG